MSVSEDSILNLVGMAYDAALDEKKWPAFLEGFSQAINSNFCALFSENLQTSSAGFQYSIGWDPAWQAAYCNHFINLDYQTPVLAQKVGEIKSNDRDLDMSKYRKTEFYNDFCVPQNQIHTMGSMLANDGDSTLLFSVQRGKRFGAFGEAEARLMSILAPHVTRAVKVHRRISSATAEKEWALGALDQLGMGVILTDRTATALFVNRAAEQMLGQGINLFQGRLALCSTPKTVSLYKLVADAAQGTPEARRGGDMRIAMANNEFLHCMVMPIPLALSARWDIPLASGCVALFLSRPGGLQLPPQRLAALYGLTPAEARLAAKLVELKKLEQVADELFITVHTARSHLKTIFAKTGAKCQSELLLMLATGTLAHFG